jgi:hypothetical protein
MKLNVNEVKALKEDRVRPLLQDNEDLALAGKVSKEAIDFLTRQIRTIERVVEGRIELKGSYRYLLTLPGVGKILALTIMLETGPVSRFAKVGNYVSYCRKVCSHWSSNGKLKGGGNKKNGNRYLAWAFSEAAELARRYYPEPRAYYQRKIQKTNLMVAHSALAHKLARAAYYVMRDQVPFRPEKLFHNPWAGTVNQNWGWPTTTRPDWDPFHPRDKVTSIFTAHAMSHPGLVHNHKNCSTSIWTWHGTEGFLGPQSGQGSNSDLNPDG